LLLRASAVTAGKMIFAKSKRTRSPASESYFGIEDGQSLFLQDLSLSATVAALMAIARPPRT
jgi:hypothetical protein